VSASYVVVSHVEVAAAGVEVLEGAFANRLGEVERAPGFQRLEVWRSEEADGVYQMVTWWDREEDFRAYMRSAAHRRSHARIPVEPAAPRGAGLDRFRVVAR
jgi:heme oxygenase (mycobilin-producing)